MLTSFYLLGEEPTAFVRTGHKSSYPFYYVIVLFESTNLLRLTLIRSEFDLSTSERQ